MAKIIAVLSLDPAATAEARSAAVTRIGCDMPLWGDVERPTHLYCGAPVKIITHANGQVRRLSWCTDCAQRVATKATGVGFQMKGWGRAA